MRAWLNGVEIPSEPVEDCPFWFHEIEGWYSLTEDKIPVDERSQGHGAFSVSKAFRASAVISLHLNFHALDEAELLSAKSRILGLVSESPVPLVVEDVLARTERIVTVRAAAIPDHHGRKHNQIILDCLARDPRRYSLDDAWVRGFPATPPVGGLRWNVVFPAVWEGSAQHDGRIKLTNRGIFSSMPKYRIHGGFDSFELINIESQQRVAYDFRLAPGGFVELDFSTRTALINNAANASRFLTSRQWWSIPAGGTITTQIRFVNESEGAFFEGLIRSAW